MDQKIDESFTFIEKNLNELPDSKGILRCVLFADVLRVVSALHENVKAQMETDKEEKLVLEAKIRDLEEEIATLKAERREQ